MYQTYSLALVKSGGCPVAMPFPLPMWPIPNPFNANNMKTTEVLGWTRETGKQKNKRELKGEEQKNKQDKGQTIQNTQTQPNKPNNHNKQPQTTTNNHNKQPQQINHNKPHTRCELLGGGGFKMAVRGGGVGWLPVLPRQPHHAVIVPCFGVAPVNQNQSREGSNQSKTALDHTRHCRPT